LAVDLKQSHEDYSSETEPKSYTSNALRLFVEGLEKPGAGQMLDVGPVCNENINFFARRVRRLYVCDLFIRFGNLKHESRSFGNGWRDLDYPPESFDGIVLWDLIDRLDDPAVVRLKDRCHRMVKRKGMVVAMALSQQERNPVVNSFVIGENYRLFVRPQRHMDLPFYFRQNREILQALSPFSAVKSFLYRNGVREFLLTK